ncbi:glycosyltransferase family 2 protein [Formosa undariae]|uniref:Glycosyltransferase family 2 protein n=1 Tax=Formosa undariae TaxID=1325436 RepID=A0ABV5F601_9FLAO
MNAFFSVVIPLYNKQNHIKNTIDSVINQNFKDFEIIIVNDGSTDHSLDVINTISDTRLNIYTIENQGVSFARNFGVRKTSTEHIVFLDADDYWEENHLETLFQLSEAYPNTGLFATGYYKQYFNKPRFKATYNTIPEEYSGVISNFFEASMIDNIAWTSAVMIPKSTLEAIGPFNENMRSGQDTELWIRIALQKQVVFSKKPTATKVITDVENHLSYSESRIDRLQIFETFKSYETDNKSLKRYLDSNRFSTAIQRKQNGDFDNYNKLKSDLNFKNLNIKQRLLLHSPAFLLRFLKKVQFKLLKNNIYLTAFK